MCASAFPPSHYMIKYLGCFILEHSTNRTDPYKEIAEFCMNRLKNTVFYGARNLVPSLGELSYLKVLQSSL